MLRLFILLCGTCSQLDRSLVNAVPLGLATMIPAVQCQLDTGMITIWEGQYQHYNIKTSGAVVGHVVAIVQEIPIDQRHCQGEDEYSWGCADTGEYWSGPASGNARAAAAPDRGHGSTGGLGSSVEERRRRGGGRGSFANSSRHRRGGVRRSSAASPRRGTRIVSEQVAATPRRRTRIVCRWVAARPPRTGRGETTADGPRRTGSVTDRHWEEDAFPTAFTLEKIKDGPAFTYDCRGKGEFLSADPLEKVKGGGLSYDCFNGEWLQFPLDEFDLDYALARAEYRHGDAAATERNIIAATPWRRNGTPSRRRPRRTKRPTAHAFDPTQAKPMPRVSVNARDRFYAVTQGDSPIVAYLHLKARGNRYAQQWYGVRGKLQHAVVGVGEDTIHFRQSKVPAPGALKVHAIDRD